MGGKHARASAAAPGPADLADASAM
jgi:hypothetical protein